MSIFKSIKIQSYEVGLLFRDGEFDGLLNQGRYRFFDPLNRIRVDVVSQRDPWLVHDKLDLIVKSDALQDRAIVLDLQDHERALVWVDNRFSHVLPTGLYAYWKEPSTAKVADVDLRESMVDVSGQDIMTADKVTLRLNTVVTYQVSDARKTVTQTHDVRQALYRETQLVLRGVVGARELDRFLVDKDAVSQEIEEHIRRRAAQLGLTVASVGIRDVILPGDMKDLMNRVTEAKKAAEANLISRREETAVMRSQANTAKLLVDNPVLMRLRELEVLERVAASGKLNIVLGERAEGEKGLADKVVGLL